MKIRMSMVAALTVAILVGFGSMDARVRDERHLRGFVDEMRKSDTGLAIALLYFYDRDDDKATRRAVKDYRGEFEVVSKQEPLVRFVSANLARERAADIKEEYYTQLGLEGRRPVLLLFRNGSPEPVTDKMGKTRMLIGLTDREKIRDFLYDAFLDDIKKAAKEEIKDRRERRRRRWYYAPYYWGGWGYPWGYGYPYYGGYWGWHGGW